jgi:Na+-translocating ferredoxin:NAD+ oxidoreductase subunit B
MSNEIYQKLYETLRKRGGWYGARDIPEFYALAEALFTPEEAEVQCSMPRTPSTAEMIANEMNHKEDEVSRILEAMTNKGCCISANIEGTQWYMPLQLLLLSELPFESGARTEWHRRLAKNVFDYRKTINESEGPPKLDFPVNRTIPIETTIQVNNQVNSYKQIMQYVEKNDLIAVAHCYCRHAAELVDEKDVCGKPNEVCMTFGPSAAFIVERKMGREVGKEEARELLLKAEKAGLVHCTMNFQDIQVLCNCCPDHCIMLKIALAQPKPGWALSSGFEARVDEALCKGDGVCVEICPSKARTIGQNGIAQTDSDRCFGCGLCVTGCPSQASLLVAKEEAAVPPIDENALREAVKAHRQA